MYRFHSFLKTIRAFKNGTYHYIETNRDVAPFSFFKWIVYNPTQFNNTELQHIIAHERVHARQKHSIDIILNQLACVVFWFNPFVWLYKRELQQNLEFIADQEAQDVSPCEKSYQLVLLKSSVPNHQFILTNNFYNSQIKKRIVMLHKSKSNKLNALKYILIVPVLALFLMSFNTKEIFVEKEMPISENTLIEDASPGEDLNLIYDTLAENKEKVSFEKKSKTNSQTSNFASVTTKKNSQKVDAFVSSKQDTTTNNIYFGDEDIEMVLITKDYSEADLDKVKADLKKKGMSVKFKSIKRNKSGEITGIKITLSSKNSNANYNINSDEAISPIKISFGENGDNISIGNAHMVHSGDNTFYFNSHEGKHKVHRTGKGNNVFVISDEEHDHDDDDDHDVHEDIIIKKKGKEGKHKNIKRSKRVEIISGDDDDDDKFEIIIDGDKIHEDDDDIFIIKGKEGKGKTIWTHDDDNTIVLKTIGKGNTFFISGDDDKNTLFILDGKEITKKQMQELDTDTIEKVEVLKGDKATEKYGDKAKDGVILITTKKKN